MKRYLKRIIKAVLNKNISEHYIQTKYIYAERKRFSDKVAFITGASGAIGEAIVWALAIEGAKVYIGGRNAEKLNTLSKELESKGLTGIPCSIDVSNEQSIKEAISNIIKAEDKIDILVNCAGGSSREKCAELHEQNIEVIDDILNTNLRGSMLCTRAAAKYMVEKKYGKIVNISSVIADGGKPKFADYAAAKAGIIGYTKSCAQELAKYGINVNCVSPGYIQRGVFGESTKKYLQDTCFINKFGTPDDIASAVCFVASDEAGFIVGQNIKVDGGRSLGLHGD